MTPAGAAGATTPAAWWTAAMSRQRHCSAPWTTRRPSTMTVSCGGPPTWSTARPMPTASGSRAPRTSTCSLWARTPRMAASTRPSTPQAPTGHCARASLNTRRATPPTSSASASSLAALPARTSTLTTLSLARRVPTAPPTMPRTATSRRASTSGSSTGARTA